MAMYIVFLGIIPIIAIVAFLMYYTKHNVNFKWQKTSVAYVVSNCFKHVKNCACCGCGFNCGCGRCCGGKSTPSIPTISHKVADAQSGSIRNLNLEIKPTALIFTTNTHVLNNFASCSNVLPVKVDLTAEQQQPQKQKQKRRMSLKNIKSLKINTSLRLKPLKNHHDIDNTPKTSETYISPESVGVGVDSDELKYVNVQNLTKRFQSDGATSSISTTSTISPGTSYKC